MTACMLCPLVHSWVEEIESMTKCRITKPVYPELDAQVERQLGLTREAPKKRPRRTTLASEPDLKTTSRKSTRASQYPTMETASASKWLVVKESTIPGAGNGLFTKKKIMKHKVIGKPLLFLSLLHNLQITSIYFFLWLLRYICRKEDLVQIHSWCF